MKHLHDILTSLLPMLIALALTSCGDTDAPAPPDVAPGGRYMELSLNMAAAGRSDAHDPLEPGVNNENRVDNICMFFYTADDGINASGDTPIEHALYFDGLAVELMFNRPVRVVLELDEKNPFKIGQHVAVLINMGDVRNKLHTLGQVRDYISASWQEATAIPDYRLFAMSTASDHDAILSCKSSGGVDSDNSEVGGIDNPYTFSAEVERTAARIDFAFDASNIAPDGTLVYDVTGPTGYVIARAYLTDMEVFNIHRQSPYAVKRVTEGLDLKGPVSYATEEQIGLNGMPSNYVIEPNTLKKDAASNLEDLFGPLRQSTLSSGIFSGGIQRYTDHRFTLTDNSWAYSAIIAYANESTQAAGLSADSFAPGIAIKARYVPHVVVGDGVEYDDFDVPPGRDLARYVPTKGDDQGKTIWFAGGDLARAYAAEHLADEAEITDYPGGVCYYMLHLRHHIADGSGPVSPFAMEYAVVRNHVYRVGVRVTGPGMIEFNREEPTGIEWRIFVRKWNYREHSGIIM